MAKKNSIHNLNNILILFSVIIIIIALGNIYIVTNKTSSFKKALTGYAAGYVNLTVVTVTSINISQNTVNFSSGSVTLGQDYASLETNNSSIANVSSGNWSTSAQAIVIENYGNTNCSLNISATKTAATFIGGSNPMYAWRWQNKDVGACNRGYNSSQTLSTWYNISANVGVIMCNDTGHSINSRAMWLNFRMIVPSDATNDTSADSDIITITGGPVL